ncbi:MAG: hypothetical protein JSV89_07980 [Spirochaetaceae bacterium]|nr:MAG: hypothetical protein JSV89_07980 [Spirochaetaceae bacterium]
MVNVKAAVSKAMGYLKDMYQIEQFKDVLLEEVDISEDNKYWNVTIGFTRRQESTSGGPMATLIGQSTEFKREFKVFQIDAETGDLRSMRSRKGE